MNTNIFVPTKINVGFQERKDTYTGKLAYVIYFDEKGKLRKETSWQGWRDENIPNEIYDNEPMEGFVLNKKVGGDRYGWNPRQTYTRVYDPRGFEFEITIPNLLWILENCNCIKGKGLEGEFVYGWDGKELVLVPVESSDYKEIQEKNKVIHNNTFIKARDDFKNKYFPFDEDSIKLYIDKSHQEEMDTEIYMDITLSHYPLRDYKSMWSEMNNIVKDYAKIGKRNKNAIEHGKLAKHMMHLIRLYLMVIDILEKKEIITYRENDHDFLMEIRNGKYLDANRQPTEEFFSIVENLQKRFEYAKQNTDLPDNPDYKRINEFNFL